MEKDGGLVTPKLIGVIPRIPAGHQNRSELRAAYMSVTVFANASQSKRSHGELMYLDQDFRTTMIRTAAIALVDKITSFDEAKALADFI
jgi:hypothetical protein